MVNFSVFVPAETSDRPPQKLSNNNDNHNNNIIKNNIQRIKVFPNVLIKFENKITGRSMDLSSQRVPAGTAFWYSILVGIVDSHVVSKLNYTFLEYFNPTNVYFYNIQV